ncbi:MAG: hypothetical protein KF758_02800 [Anaerolineales bacterium]|nr:hypothetical protein [Anaerolineales bacterium]MBX3035816.1 hypothetical protein [Anaerolineales bacterium]
MPGVFDRLEKEIKVRQQQDGITALDLVDLPPALRKIMRLMLRELQMSYPRLREAMESMPETDRLTPDQLDAALSNLTQQFWLTHIGEGEKAIYKVNLRKKTGSTLAAGIWSSLDTKLKGKPKE